MLTAEQTEALRDALEKISEPVNRYIIRDIVRRIADAGDVTSTAEYQAKIARQLQLSKKDLDKFLSEEFERESQEYKVLFKKISTLVWTQTYSNMDFPAPNDAENLEALERITDAALALSNGTMKNITQTLGLIDPYGNPLTLRDAYISYTDYAFKKVLTGAQSYQEAMVSTVANLTKYGVRVVDYESGVHSSLDVAIRRNIFGGMGLMVEQIEQRAHDEIGCDGWEISAHEACATDHQPYQGRQYTDEQYMALNGTAAAPGILARRIGTLNCKHTAFPIIIGVNEPQYTDEQLDDMQKRNEKGITYQGRHYTTYEATQVQRSLERSIRAQRRKLIAYKAAPGLEEQYKKASARYNVLRDRYNDFSSAAGLRTQEQRLAVIGYGPAIEKDVRIQ